MMLRYTLGKEERTEVVIERNWFTGSFVYRENGEEHRIRSAGSLSTHVNLKFTQEYEFEVGAEEIHRIKIIHSRPVLFGGLRPQTFEVSANGSLLETYIGY